MIASAIERWNHGSVKSTIRESIQSPALIVSVVLGAFYAYSALSNGQFSHFVASALIGGGFVLLATFSRGKDDTNVPRRAVLGLLMAFTIVGLYYVISVLWAVYQQPPREVSPTMIIPLFVLLLFGGLHFISKVLFLLTTGIAALVRGPVTDCQREMMRSFSNRL